jgi:uncharacterized protein with GYD domain
MWGNVAQRKDGCAKMVLVLETTQRGNLRMDTYTKAYRAALPLTRKDHDDERHAKDAASAIAATVMSLRKGTIEMRDLRKSDEPAMVAALKATK